eukprot:1144177-Pelagomonas_calceolata.AAC.7
MGKCMGLLKGRPNPMSCRDYRGYLSAEELQARGTVCVIFTVDTTELSSRLSVDICASLFELDEGVVRNVGFDFMSAAYRLTPVNGWLVHIADKNECAEV